MDVETPVRQILLDGVLIPRANGSDGLERVEDFLATTLEASGAEVKRLPFNATPFGLQLAWTAALLLMVGCVASILVGWYPTAILLALAVPALLLVEFEFLLSPVSGLFKREEHNVVGRFAGRPGGPKLILCAHYDTTTHFGDHRTWGPLGWWWLGPAVALAVATAIAGMLRGSLPISLSLPSSILVLVPFAAMAWYQGAGPLLCTPSPGALDNGGSVVALLELADRLRHRPPDSPATIEILFTPRLRRDPGPYLPPAICCGRRCTAPTVCHGRQSRAHRRRRAARPRNCRRLCPAPLLEPALARRDDQRHRPRGLGFAAGSGQPARGHAHRRTLLPRAWSSRGDADHGIGGRFSSPTALIEGQP